MDRELQQEFKIIHGEFSRIHNQIEKIDIRLDKIDSGLNIAEQRLSSGEQKHEDLTVFLRENMVTRLEFRELLEKAADIDSSLKTVEIALDNYAKQSKEYYQEVTVAIANTNRIERFLRDVVAPKLGVKYDA